MKEQKTIPFFGLGFRPFFSLGVLFSIFALLLWGFIFSGKLEVNVYGGGYFWHIHEMLFGFGCAIFIGFLLTALQTWTGERSLHGKPLILLVALWLLGRLAMFFPQILGNFASAILDISFMPLAIFFIGLPIFKAKQKRNFFIPPFLCFFALANIYMHLSVAEMASIQLMPSAYASVILVVLLMSAISGRVVPMFTANGTGTARVQPVWWLDRIINISLLLLVICYLAHPFFEVANMVKGALFFLAGIAQMLRFFRWKAWITLKVPLLWSLHSALFFTWFGLIVVGMAYIDNSIVPLKHAWHLITIGGMSGLILAMISRVSLGHTGQKLVAPKIMIFAFLMLPLGAVIRVFGPLIRPDYYLTFVNISILFWVLAFSIYAIKNIPILASPRLDGRDI